VFDQIEAFFALTDRIKRWRRSKTALTDESVASRFIRLFESHGVHRNQIPRFFDHGLRLADVKDASVLLPRLDEPMLDDACRLFAVRREWLDGAEKRIYPCHDFYKRPDQFASFVDGIASENPQGDIDGLLIVPEPPGHEPEALLIIEESVGFVGDKAIRRFHLCNNWSFAYWKARAYLTACVAIAWKRDIHIRGIYSPAKELSKIVEGESLLGWQGEGLQAIHGKRWDAEDMALKPEVYLRGIDPERQRYGLRAALELWLDLDGQGLMDTGLDVSGVRERFIAERKKY
jgi:hypothetical protein